MDNGTTPKVKHDEANMEKANTIQYLFLYNATKPVKA